MKLHAYCMKFHANCLHKISNSIFREKSEKHFKMLSAEMLSLNNDLVKGQ